MAEKTLVIVGVGTVGTQIAGLAKDAGWSVLGIEKDAASAQAAAERTGVSVTAEVAEAKGAGLVIECLPENAALKHAVFG